MSEGFFNRWSKRKDAVREGKPVEPEPAAETPSALAEGTGEGPAQPEPQPTPPPPPTLEDVQSLTPESDFRRFVAADVAPEVKNAAMKKLFADSHFNVMDGLDSHIGDYSKSEPIPREMLKKLASAKTLNLFDDDAREDVDHIAAQSVAQSNEEAHANPDLRLQQDDAAGPESPRQDTE